MDSASASPAVLSLDEGDAMTLTCTTSSSGTQPRVKWTKQVRTFFLCLDAKINLVFKSHITNTDSKDPPLLCSFSRYSHVWQTEVYINVEIR